MKMTLIADSGSTKTGWLLLEGQRELGRHATQGINPFMMTEEEIRQTVLAELCAWLAAPVDELFFYGAGCRDEAASLVSRALQSALHIPPGHCHVYSDLLAAARALCGHEAGIACILGTGSNSCYYDGEEIGANVPPLGYVLGDEASGASLGRRLVSDYLKELLPEDLTTHFRREYPTLDAAEVVRRVYREPLPNRFLASFVPFLFKHKESAAVQEIIRNEMLRFLQRNVAHYASSAKERPAVHFVGGVAHAFSEEVRAVATAEGWTVGRILREPLDGLCRFHAEKRARL